MVEQKHVQTLMIMFIVNYVFRLIVRVCGLMLDCTSPLDVKSGERSLLFFNYRRELESLHGGFMYMYICMYFF